MVRNPSRATMAYGTLRMREEHRDAVIKLWCEALHDPNVARVAAERFAWFYEENPRGRPVTWLGVASGTDEIIGCGSIYRRTTVVRGQPVSSGVMSDFAVAKAHRIAGCAIAIQRAIVNHSRADGFDFVYAFPNEGSLAVVKRVGHKIIGEAAAYTKPLRTATKLRAQLQNRWLARAAENPVVADAAGFLLDLGLTAIDLARILPILGAYRVEERREADPRVDDLWSRARWDYVIGERTAAFLNWRYARFKGETYRFLHVVERATDKLVGYVVYRVDDNKAIVMDVFAERFGEALDHVLLHFVAQMRRERRTSIYLTYFGTAAFGRRLEALRFWRRPLKRSVIISAAPEMGEERIRLLLDPESWLMLDGELDI
jgi:hypothetical protein